MTQITFKGNTVDTVGTLVSVGTKAPDFTLVGNDLSEIKLNDFIGSKLILNIFPSIDTGVCAMSVRRFNQEAANLSNMKVLCVSNDLPFAQARFCGAEGIKNVTTASGFRSSFGKDYGVTMITGPLAGLLSRCVVVITEDGQISYSQQVPEIGTEPNYDAALAAVK